MRETSMSADDQPCRTCGACCAYSRQWPRFTTETDLELARIPPEFVDRNLSGMRCVGDRCSALEGQIGVMTTCAAYTDRPAVCRACVAGDDACRMARASYGFPELPERA
jgi:uncharacterized protein